MKYPISAGDHRRDSFIIAKVELVNCDLVGHLLEIVEVAGGKIIDDMDATAPVKKCSYERGAYKSGSAGNDKTVHAI